MELPTRQEAEEIEASSRLYVEAGTLFMIASVMVGAETPQPGLSPITFAYQRERVVTVRFAAPKPFALFERQLRAVTGRLPDGPEGPPRPLRSDHRPRRRRPRSRRLRSQPHLQSGVLRVRQAAGPQHPQLHLDPGPGGLERLARRERAREPGEPQPHPAVLHRLAAELGERAPRRLLADRRDRRLRALGSRDVHVREGELLPRRHPRAASTTSRTRSSSCSRCWRSSSCPRPSSPASTA